MSDLLVEDVDRDRELSFHTYAKQLRSDVHSFPGSFVQGHLHERVQKLQLPVSCD